MSLASLQPSDDGLDAADLLRDEVDIQRTVLEETIDSAQNGQVLEAGRTICGPNSVRPPFRRFPRSITLRRCPVGATAIVHTHPSREELLTPHHSLPDVANVVFDVDASMVVGLESAELYIRASNPDAMHREFQNALGLEVSSTSDVDDAVKSGRIPDPAVGRRRVRQDLAPLVERVPTGFDDLRAEMEGLDVPARGITAACLEGDHAHAHPRRSSAPEALRRKQHEVAANFRTSIEVFLDR